MAASLSCTDDLMSGWELSDNLIEHAKLGFELGGGRNNHVLRNTLRNVTEGVWLSTHSCTGQRARVQELLYPGSPWGERWPELRAIAADPNTTCAPVHCDVSDNRYDGGTFLRVDAGPYTNQTLDFTDRNNTLG